MGWTIRKGFKAGPFRINASRSGLGVSFGGRGARIGVSGNGRSYVSGGIGALRYRSGITSQNGPTTQQSYSATRSRDEVQFVDTKVTFERSTVDQISFSKASQNTERLGLKICVLLALTTIFVVSSTDSVSIARAFGFIFAALLTLAAVLCLVLLRIKTNGLIKDLHAILSDAMTKREPLDGAVSDLLAQTIRSERFGKNAIRAFGYGLFIQLLEHNLNGTITHNEALLMDQLEHVFSLERLECRRIKIQTLQSMIAVRTKNRELPAEDYDQLMRNIGTLDIESDAIYQELKNLNLFREIHDIRRGIRKAVTTEFNLANGEICHYEGIGRIVKEKVIGRYQSEGVKHKITGLTVDKEGSLLVTDRRILLVHSGTTSIPFKNILSTDIDYGQSSLVITKDKSVKPIQITTPDIEKVGALVKSFVGD